VIIYSIFYNQKSASCCSQSLRQKHLKKSPLRKSDGDFFRCFFWFELMKNSHRLRLQFFLRNHSCLLFRIGKVISGKKFLTRLKSCEASQKCSVPTAWNSRLSVCTIFSAAASQSESLREKSRNGFFRYSHRMFAAARRHNIQSDIRREKYTLLRRKQGSRHTKSPSHHQKGEAFVLNQRI
jgi:hypothetical protein